MRVEGFDGIQPLYEGGQATVVRARRAADGEPVVLKILRGPYPSAGARRQFRLEAEITERVQGPGVIGLLGAELEAPLPYLVLEDFGGISLSHQLRAGPLAVSQALEVALELADALGRVHERLVVHKDVSPANVVWRRDTNTVRLIDFGIASRVSHERPVLASPRILQGTLPFISPEQTGRMNRRVDYRSDYYSFGATLFALLTGAAPFAIDDPLELVHAHVARTPPDVRTLAPSVSPALAGVIAKLLAKTAEERYQSAFGLRRDLERCLAAVRGEAPPVFAPGADDRPTRVTIPERLYGRADDVEELVDAYRAAQDGGREVIFVRGYSGIGKTSVVNEIHREMSGTPGVFVSGKFEQYRRGQPYASLAVAFGELCQRLLAESDEQVSRWRDTIRAALDESGQVLADLIPALGALLGPLPIAPHVPPAESEARLHAVFRSFVQALSAPEHPLVLFVDDLQWADLPTLRLLELLATDDDLGHLMLIGAYRDNAVDASHPLTHTLAALRSSRTRCRELELQPLGSADVRRYLEDALKTSGNNVQALARLCRDKTDGNPFFLAQFLRSLETHGLLRFDPAEGDWSWNADAIRSLAHTENVVELMALRLRDLPAATRHVLSAAGLLGATFDVGRLSSVLERPTAEVRHALGAAEEEGYIAELGAGQRIRELDNATFEFAHDRVQQAAVDFLGSEERRALHHRIGMRLWSTTPDLGASDAIFDVVHHLREAADELDDDTRLALARVVLTAAQRARAAAAPDLTRDALYDAIAWVGGASVDPSLVHALHVEAGTVGYLLQDYEASDQHVAHLLAMAATPPQKVEALRLRMAAQIAQDQPHAAIATGIEALSCLGLELDPSPNLDTVMSAMGSASDLLASIDLAALPDGPLLEDPERRTAMRLLMELAPPAYLVEPSLMALLATAIVRVTVVDGLTPESTYGFALYGLMLCDAGYVAQGHAMGQLAMALAARFPEERRTRVRATHVHYGFVRHWKQPLVEVVRDYRELGREAVAIGDYEYAGFAMMMTGMYSLHAGEPFERLAPLLARYCDAMRQLDQSVSLSLLAIPNQVVLNLMGASDDALALTGDAMDETSLLPFYEEIGNPTGLFVFHCFKAILAVALGEWDVAWTHALAALPHERAGATATFHLPVFYTIVAILALQKYEATGDDEWMDLASASRTRVDAWATSNPSNLRHKAALIAAEFARVQGLPNDALSAYERAIEAARDEAFLSDEALANELAARFLQQRGSRTAARGFLLDARYALERWGALAALERFDARHPGIEADSRGMRTSISSMATTYSGSLDLDGETVLQASQAISKELQLDQLVRTLVKLALESSGARRAVFALRTGEQFVIAAHGRCDPGLDIEVPTARPSAEASELLAVGALKLVERTHEVLLIEDAATSGVLTRDPFVVEHRVRSLLALPVVRHGRMLAVLYMDNDRTPGVFTGERLALARVLLTQAAISLENARLYEALEERVRERTTELEAARDEAERARLESDRLLKNTLPGPIAEELKATGHARPVHVASATVLFTDFCGFTERASGLTPAEVVDELETCFGHFDEITDRWGIEKLKTIGDGYMAVGGVPRESATHVVDGLLAALEMVAFAREAGAGFGLAVRAGLHTGPLVAGVIGRRRFAYDVWGDTVNMASRMESHGEAGRVNISSATHALAQHLFVCEKRALTEVKGKGTIQMYFVDGIRPELSVGGAGREPSDAFWHRVAELTAADVSARLGRDASS